MAKRTTAETCEHRPGMPTILSRQQEIDTLHWNAQEEIRHLSQSTAIHHQAITKTSTACTILCDTSRGKNYIQLNITYPNLDYLKPQLSRQAPAICRAHTSQNEWTRCNKCFALTHFWLHWFIENFLTDYRNNCWLASIPKCSENRGSIVQIWAYGDRVSNSNNIINDDDDNDDNDCVFCLIGHGPLWQWRVPKWQEVTLLRLEKHKFFI